MCVKAVHRPSRHRQLLHLPPSSMGRHGSHVPIRLAQRRPRCVSLRLHSRRHRIDSRGQFFRRDGLNVTRTFRTIQDEPLIVSRIPNVGAQYRWSARFAQRAPAFWGFMQGWITTLAWICNVSAAMSVLSNTAYGLVIFNYPDYEPRPWHQTLLLIGFTLTLTVCNFGLRSVVNPLEKIGGVLHVVLFVVIVAVLTAMSPHSSNEFVFRTLTTQSGWDNPGIAWSIGLLTAVFPISSFDSVLHMSTILSLEAPLF